MNNGERVDIEEKQDPSFDFSVTLNNSDKWFKHNDKIINLDNVSYVSIETETQRQKINDDLQATARAWNL